MAPITIRKAIGAVKDQTSIGIAKVVGNVAPDLEVLIVKATSHDDEPADDKYTRDIVNLMSCSKGYVNACVFAISKRLSKTRDWIVAVKALMLVHKLLVVGTPLFGEELIHASRKGTRVLNMSDFRDEAHSYSWDHVGFVKSYALYLDQKIDFSIYERSLSGVDDKNPEFGVDYGHGMNKWPRSYGDQDETVVLGVGEKGRLLREMKTEKISQRLNQLLRLLDRFLACRPNGAAKDSRIILVAVYSLVKESFKLYVDLCEVLHVLLDRFSDLEYEDCLKSFDTYVGAAKMIEELVGFYSWCKDTGIARSSEYPELQEIADKLMEKLEGFLRGRAVTRNSREKTRGVNTLVIKEEEKLTDLGEMKALPPTKDYNSPTPQPLLQAQPKPQTQQTTEDLVNLKDDATSVEVQGNKLALTLFSETPAVNADGSWEVFHSDGEPGITSAWQTPAAEIGKADWELTLVETASNLSKQKADMGGGIDSLLLSGMYDQGAVKQHVINAQLIVGSASSVTLPRIGKGSAPVLALPAPDGTVQVVGNQDPFAASLVVPPPSYVQMADMEMKQHLLVQEQQLWQQFANSGMQGQVGSANATGGTTGCYNGTGQPGGYYHHTPY
ncbi:putative clathrin assembly protein At4g32285 [Apium graveolens]|uniref:putative clathrin assembly protein At4g32285 n=1 Tax=Apium graveolens TaxID=4045 RepID=UPI003D7AEF5D